MSCRSSVPAAGVAKAKGEQDLPIVPPMLSGICRGQLTLALTARLPKMVAPACPFGRARPRRTATLIRRVNASLPIRRICYAVVWAIKWHEDDVGLLGPRELLLKCRDDREG